MSELPFHHMQHAVDIVSSSAHPENKIAATLFGDDWAVSRTNEWPEIIARVLGTDIRIGNSSGTIHAETNCILHAPGATQGASLCITDPFCPNCAKNIVEAGIAKIYIDHKGFDKDFFKRRSGHFDTMSMKICEKAGVSVFELNRREEKITPILEIGTGYIPPEDSPITMEPVNLATDAVLRQLVTKTTRLQSRRKFSIALAKNSNGQIYALTARAHAVTGYTMQNEQDELEVMNPESKYSYIQEPVNRLLMGMMRRGLTLCDGYLYCSQIPTSREQVNLVGAGVRRITIGDMTRARDPHGRQAMKQLSTAKILSFT